MDFEDISQFTPQEQAALNYHRANLLNSTFLRQPDGGITTFYGSVLPARAVFPNRKGEVIIPTYWGGDIRKMPEAVKFAAKSGIDFPVYPDAETALAAEKRMHEIMERDTQAFNKAKPFFGDKKRGK
jgi:hypothetical protein